MATYEETKTLVLERLRAWIASLPEAEKNMPRTVINFQPYSPLSLLREVEMDTDIGRAFIYQQATALGIVIPAPIVLHFPGVYYYYGGGGGGEGGQ